jgi:uncharacterized repeat protein (TIGR01451 family)
MVLAGSGNAANSTDLATSAGTVAKMHSYLRSIGIDPRNVVIQLGKRNYAGPRCPGKGWNCTNKTRVLQWGTDNVVQCQPSGSVVQRINDNGNQKCVIVQNNPTARNVASCVERSDAATAVQDCNIAQNGIANVAAVEQLVETSRGPTLDATQTATVTQTGATIKNVLELRQKVKQDVDPSDDTGDDTDDNDDATPSDANPTGTVQEDAHQRADIVQSALRAGNNSTLIRQRQKQHAHGGDVQLQNTLPGTTGDCAPNPNGPSTPNECVNLAQTAVGGNNLNDLVQKIRQKARTNVVATQTQGAATGGIDARVHEETVTGSSLNQATQVKKHKMRGAPGSSQTQFDPVACCGADSQTGGSGNTETINQSVSQRASEDGALQSAHLFAESLTPQGTCEANQQASNNADSTTNTATFSPCPFLLLETSCSNSSDGGGCTASEPVTSPPGTPRSAVTTLIRNVTTQETTYSPSTDVGFGSTVEYQIIYSNLGDGTAHSVTLTDTLPAIASSVSCTGGCTIDTPAGAPTVLTWSLGDVPAGESRTVTAQASVCGITSNATTADGKEESPVTSAAATTTGSCLT